MKLTDSMVGKRVCMTGMAVVTVMTFLFTTPGKLLVPQGSDIAAAAERPVSVDSCLISQDQVICSASCKTIPTSDDGIFYLFADEVYEDGVQGKIIARAERGKKATFTFPLNLNTPDSNLSRKFLVAVKSGGSMVQVSNEHYITNPEAVAVHTSARMTTGKKGILPDQFKLSTNELKDLNVKQAVYNMNLGYLCGETTDVAYPTIAYEYDGQTYYFNGKIVTEYDNIIKVFNMQGIQVTMAILNNGAEATKDLIHPLARDGHTWSALAWPGYAFNTAEKDGTKHLEAVAAFLGERYSGTENCGQVDNWIIGNEVNARTECYYLGTDNLDTNVNSYVKAFRIFYNGIKSQNAGAQIYNSLDQEWARKSNPGCFLSKDYLDRFNYYMCREGNIDWGLSFHPYDAPLYDPYAWKGQAIYVKNDISTPYITMQNLHILTDYMNQTEFLNPQGQTRNISLAEIGFTSSFGEELQAASVAYGYLVAEANPYINGFLLFRETDDSHEMESNLALGLCGPDGTHKMSYDFYKNIDGPNAAEYKKRASDIIGMDIDQMISSGTFVTR